MAKVTNNMIEVWIKDYLERTQKHSVFDRRWNGVLIHKLRKENYNGYPQTASQRWREEIDNAMTKLQQYSTFEELYNKVCEIEVKGIGELSKYDTATCIGCPLKIFPEYVYLHAGTKDGAKAIGIVGKNVEKSVFVKKFPAFEELEPIQIEDFLCIYKNRLGGDINARITICCD